MTPRSLSESHRHTLQEFPAASALLCNLNLDGALQVLEIHIERTDDESSHLQICVCGVRGMDAEHWATERSDSSVLSIHLADSLLWFGALRCETPQPAYLRIEASHLPLRLPSLHQCRLTLSIGTHAARMHAWAVAERRRLRELAAQSLLAPLMNQLDKIGEEAFVLGFRNSLRSLGAHRSSAVFANMVPLLLDGWIESVRQDRTEGAIKTKR